MKTEKAGLQSIKPGEPLRLLEFDEVLDHFQEVYDSIARRAYDIFENRGRTEGRDFDDWLRAESEFLRPVPVHITESPEALTVRAEVPGFKTSELEVGVEQGRVTISGKKEGKSESKGARTVYTEWRSDRVFRVFELPAHVDPEKAKASLKDGVLELVIAKATPAKKVPVEMKAA